MNKFTRVLTTAAAGAAATLALTAGSAQATPQSSVYLYTGSNAHCTTTGDNGVAGGVFSGYGCRSGFAGYSLSVDATGASFSNVYLNTFSTLATCTSAGDNGTTGGVWGSYHCQSGFAGYSLSVSA
ncbi:MULTISPECIES: hypothetical protein [unclassified Saccharothrix]|uniref:hypothetical protein n=1 Tax=unclassified Saccharothrix TaxID=2593673 RepID=UPI00307D6050